MLLVEDDITDVATAGGAATSDKTPEDDDNTLDSLSDLRGTKSGSSGFDESPSLLLLSGLDATL